eukprot:TRINITY_DN20578_c0_g1_i2.p1 TRINITY_DN20578_c0_g1~~TRINITY_DN20578_c0_g1_i2.p1  ORF type:complete len:101 (-),score=21.31 TRINITY_DN20578_c0_g1_i2:85-387(-)
MCIRDRYQRRVHGEKYSKELREEQYKSEKRVSEANERIKQLETDYETKTKDLKGEIAILKSKCITMEEHTARLNQEISKLAQYKSLFSVEKDNVISLYAY